jgi:hypothetical protein
MVPGINRRVASAVNPQQPPTPRPAPAIFANYAKRDLPAILDAARKVPAGNPAVIGTYGINKEEALAIKALPNGQYAPIFGLVRAKTPKYFEGIPEVADLKSWAEAVNAGKEVGRRMRDAIEAARANGVPVDSWQLDELWPSLSDGQNPERDAIGREYIRGVIEGISRGRDGVLLPGYVYVAKFNKLADVGNGPQMKRMWATLDRATLGVMGEEYPPFRGTAQERAAGHAQAVELVREYGEHGANVARKYMPLLTPGNRPGGALGGRQPGQTLEQAQRWQDQYTDVRVSEGVAGIGFFGFVKTREGDIGDTDPELIRRLADDVRRSMLALNAR